MALSAKEIKIGAVVSGRCGQRRFDGTVTEATDVTITVANTFGVETIICPAWADVLVVDGKETPAPKPMETPKRITLKEYRPLLPGNIADIERQRADRNYQAVTEWKVKQKQEEKPMSSEAKLAAMMKAREKLLSTPIDCADCGAEVFRKSTSTKRCPTCQATHKKEIIKAALKAKADDAAKAADANKVDEPPKCLDCGEPFVRTAPNQTRDPICQKKRTDAIKMQWAQKARDRKIAAKAAATGTSSTAGTSEKAEVAAADRKLSSETRESKESTESIQPPAPASIHSDHSIPSIPSPSGRRRIGLVPITALERAHGQIQALWLEIARLQAQLEG